MGRSHRSLCYHCPCSNSDIRWLLASVVIVDISLAVVMLCSYLSGLCNSTKKSISSLCCCSIGRSGRRRLECSERSVVPHSRAVFLAGLSRSVPKIKKIIQNYVLKNTEKFQNFDKTIYFKVHL